MIGQEEALWVMFLVGAMGTPVFIESEHEEFRVAAAVWVAVWWLPPLVMLWVKGVFG